MLVVEDEAAVLKLADKMLTGLSVTVLTALNSEAVLKTAEEQEDIDLARKVRETLRMMNKKQEE